VEEDVDGDGILLENDPVDDDITISIASDYDRPFSHTSSLEQQRAHIASSDGTPPPVDSVGVSAVVLLLDGCRKQTQW